MSIMSERRLLEYVSRADRLPLNLALELSRSVLYEDAAAALQSLTSHAAAALQSLTSHADAARYSGDSLWNGKPQHYFESMRFDEDSLDDTDHPQ